MDERQPRQVCILCVIVMLNSMPQDRDLLHSNQHTAFLRGSVPTLWSIETTSVAVHIQGHCRCSWWMVWMVRGVGGGCYERGQVSELLIRLCSAPHASNVCRNSHGVLQVSCTPSTAGPRHRHPKMLSDAIAVKLFTIPLWPTSDSENQAFPACHIDDLHRIRRLLHHNEGRFASADGLRYPFQRGIRHLRRIRAVSQRCRGPVADMRFTRSCT